MPPVEGALVSTQLRCGCFPELDSMGVAGNFSQICRSRQACRNISRFHPIGISYMKIRTNMNIANIHRRLFHAQVSHLAIVLLIALAWIIPALCGSIHSAAEAGDIARVRALLKENPEFVSSWSRLKICLCAGRR
jgi:hypothetical protein